MPRLRRQLAYLPAACAAALTLLPIIYVVIRAAGADSYAWDRLFSARTLELLVNSVGLALSVSVAAIAISLPYAWLVTSTNMPGRRFFAVTGPLPLVIPSYVGALIFVDAFGPRGLLQGFLESPFGIDRLPSIYGFFGAFVTLTLFTYPYVLLLTVAAFKRIDPTMNETARGLGFGPVSAFMRATLPQLRPALIAGGLLCALYALSDFGVVSLMRFDTFTRSIYNSYRSFYDPSGAALLALVLICLTGVILALEYKLRGDPRRMAVRSAEAARTVTTSLGRARFAGLALLLDDLRLRCCHAALRARVLARRRAGDARLQELVGQRDLRLGQRFGLCGDRRDPAGAADRVHIRPQAWARRQLDRRNRNCGLRAPRRRRRPGPGLLRHALCGTALPVTPAAGDRVRDQVSAAGGRGHARRIGTRRPGTRRSRARARPRSLPSISARDPAAGGAGHRSRRDARLPDCDEGAPRHADPQADRIRDAGDANLGGLEHGVVLGGGDSSADSDWDFGCRAVRGIVRSRRQRSPNQHD